MLALQHPLPAFAAFETYVCAAAVGPAPRPLHVAHVEPPAKRVQQCMSVLC